MENKDIDRAAREYDTPLSREILTELGFTQLPHYTVTGSMMKDIGRNRYLTIGCVGTPNEMLFLQEIADKTVIGQVVLWNYDYDGMLTLRSLKDLLWFFTKDEKYSRQSEIDELIEALEEATRWIPVSERLPERETLVNVRPKEGRRVIVACMARPDVWFDDLGNASYVPPPYYWRPIDTSKATQLLEKYRKK